MPGYAPAPMMAPQGATVVIQGQAAGYRPMPGQMMQPGMGMPMGVPMGAAIIGGAMAMGAASMAYPHHHGHKMKHGKWGKFKGMKVGKFAKGFGKRAFGKWK